MANPWDTSGAWTPQNAQELRDFAASSGWSEDFARFDDATVNSWLNSGNWDPNVRKFRSEKTDEAGNRLEGYVEKPPETPEGWYAWGAQGQARRYDAGDGGGVGEAGGEATEVVECQELAVSHSSTTRLLLRPRSKMP